MTDMYLRSPDLIRAAGAVIWRGAESSREIALIHRPKYDDWTLPKGKLDHGEHMIAGALREVFEETGLHVTIGRWLCPVHYEKNGWAKRVDYWAAMADQAGTFVRNEEVDRLAWLPLAEAETTLTHDRDRAVFRELTARPLATTPIILARYGRLAGSKVDWKGKKKVRPLDPVGMSQADSLASVLTAYRPTNLIGAPHERCVQTLYPYASRVQLTIREERLFTKKHFELAGAVRPVLNAIARDEPTAICGYQESLEKVISEICRERYDGEPPRLQLLKGSFVVMHHANGRVVAVERYRA